MITKEKAIKELKNALEKFKSDALKKGFTEDAIVKEIHHVYQNFPWYKHNKRISYCSWFFTIIVCILILHLSFTTLLFRNKIINKKVQDFLYDNQYKYHQHRLFRMLFVPLHRFYDFSKLKYQDCLIYNPFKSEPADCTLCKRFQSVAVFSEDDMNAIGSITSGEPVIFKDAHGYHDNVVTYNDYKKLFTEYAEELDNSICRIRVTTSFLKVSSYFQKSEEEIMQSNLSIGWRSCDGYATRFYRRLYTRPQFIPKLIEVSVEKEVYVLQEGVNFTLPSMFSTRMYLHQSHGESLIHLKAPPECSSVCSSQPIVLMLKQGHIAVLPVNVWSVSFRNTQKKLSIIYTGFING